MAHSFPRVIVLTWKPEINEDFGETEFNQLAQQCWNDGFVESKWRFLTKKYSAGDLVIVVRQGKQPGLVAFGKVTTNGEQIKDSGSHYARVKLSRMRDCFENPFLDKKALLLLGIRKSLLETQASGGIELDRAECTALSEKLKATLDSDLLACCAATA